MTDRPFYSKVAGVTARDENGVNRQSWIKRLCHPGKPLDYRRVPDNEHDENAIGVWIQGRVLLFWKVDVQIGYLQKALAAELAPFMDAGGVISGEVANVTGGEGRTSTLGVNILIRKQ